VCIVMKFEGSLKVQNILTMWAVTSFPRRILLFVGSQEVISFK
jgi:hypothetical protein